MLCDSRVFTAFSNVSTPTRFGKRIHKKELNTKLVCRKRAEVISQGPSIHRSADDRVYRRCGETFH